MLSRSQFLDLAGMDLELFKTLARRDQLPFEARDESRQRGNYTPMEAYMTRLAMKLVEDSHVARDFAAWVPRQAARKMWKEWSRIAAIISDPKTPHMFCGAYSGDFYVPGPYNASCFCVSWEGLAAIRSKNRLIDGLVIVNASTVAFAVHGIAQEKGIDLGDFWTSVPSL